MLKRFFAVANLILKKIKWVGYNTFYYYATTGGAYCFAINWIFN
jgi:hypothetical protein